MGRLPYQSLPMTNSGDDLVKQVLTVLLSLACVYSALLSPACHGAPAGGPPDSLLEIAKREIQVSPAISLIFRITREPYSTMPWVPARKSMPIFPLRISTIPGMTGLTLPITKDTDAWLSVADIYTVSLRAGEVETVLDRVENITSAEVRESVRPTFTVYGGMMEGNKLWYCFEKRGRVLLAMADVDSSGKVSNYRQRPFPGDRIAWVNSVKFALDKERRPVLDIDHHGKAPYRRAFRFDDAGEPFSVPVESQ